MEVNDFTLQVSQIALNLDAQNKPITVEEITDILDKRHRFDKKTYRLISQRVYQSLRELQYFAWNLWHDYIQTSKYERERKNKEYYNENEIKQAWKNEYFKEIYDAGLFTSKQIEDSVAESLVFEDFISDLKSKNIIFTIAGKGNNEYRIPTLHDFFIYKFQNMTSTTRVLHGQIEEFTDDGLMLPHGVEVPRLRDLNQNMFDALEYKKEVSESE